GAAVVLWRAATHGSIGAPADDAPARTRDAAPAAPVSVPGSARSAVPAAVPATADASSTTANAATWLVHGRVLDPSGAELRAVPVCLDGERCGVTGDAGEFIVEVPASTSTRTLAARGDGFGAL